LPKLTAISLAGLLLAATAACSGGGDSGGVTGAATKITATDFVCAVSASVVKAGNNTFAISNTGKTTTEVDVYGKQNGVFSKIMGQKKHIGPGTKAALTVNLKAASYEVACKPGEKGNGVRTKITAQ